MNVRPNTKEKFSDRSGSRRNRSFRGAGADRPFAVANQIDREWVPDVRSDDFEKLTANASHPRRARVFLRRTRPMQTLDTDVSFPAKADNHATAASRPIGLNGGRRRASMAVPVG